MTHAYIHLSRYATKMEVLDLLKRSGYVLHVMVVAGGIWATPLPNSSRTRGQGHPPGPLISREKVEQRHLKAKAFQSKVIKVNTHSYSLLHACPYTHTHSLTFLIHNSCTVLFFMSMLPHVHLSRIICALNVHSFTVSAMVLKYTYIYAGQLLSPW